MDIPRVAHNPSLLEAMASDALIVAHDNVFNKSILGKDAFYFKDYNDIRQKLHLKKGKFKDMVRMTRLRSKVYIIGIK